MQFLRATLAEITTGPAERRITIQHRKGEFGVFDGYRTGTDEIARLASAEWMEGLEREIVLLATISVKICPQDRATEAIVPNTDKPTDYHDHIFQGRLTRCVDDASDILNACQLFGDVDEEDSGIPLDTSAFEGMPVACLSLGKGSILVDLSEVKQETGHVDTGTSVEVRATRTDLLGIVG